MSDNNFEAEIRFAKACNASNLDCDIVVKVLIQLKYNYSEIAKLFKEGGYGCNEIITALLADGGDPINIFTALMRANYDFVEIVKDLNEAGRGRISIIDAITAHLNKGEKAED